MFQEVSKQNDPDYPTYKANMQTFLLPSMFKNQRTDQTTVTVQYFSRAVLMSPFTPTLLCSLLWRFLEALKARLKERLSQVQVELPPLCFCAASFWDTHPDTCANNCVFRNNPKGKNGAFRHCKRITRWLTAGFISSTAYAKALHSTMLSFALQ